MTGMLSAEREQRLLRSGSPEDRNTVIEAHLPIAYRLARRFVSDRDGVEDLVAVGALALVEAARTYSPDGPTRFGVYAQAAVRHALIRHVAKNGHGALQIPERRWAQAREVRRREPDPAATDGRTRNLLALTRPAISLNLPLDGGGELIDLVPSDGDTDGAITHIANAERSYDLVQALETLDSVERRILELVYGLGAFTRDPAGWGRGDFAPAEPLPLAEVARRIGCSERTVQRRVAEALAKLRHPLRPERLRAHVS